MDYHERMSNIVPPNGCMQAHLNVLAGGNTPGRRFLLGLYHTRMKRGEKLPDEIMGWIKEIEAYEPPKLSPHHVCSMTRSSR